MLFSEDFIIACPIFLCQNIKYWGNIEHDTIHHSRPEHKRSDRGFQFHGKQCGGSDKTDDTTQTNTAVSWKLHTAICGAFSFRNWCEERKSVKKGNLTQKIRITHRKVKHIRLFDAIWIVSRFHNYFSAIKRSLIVKGKSGFLSVTLANYSNPDNQDALWVSVRNKIWMNWYY